MVLGLVRDLYIILTPDEALQFCLEVSLVLGLPHLIVVVDLVAEHLLGG
jgi:hypothetical protein